MAFKLEVLRGATVYDISADNPISIENVDDVGGASARNQEEQGPYQDGSSHLGFRLEPRTMTLRLNVQGATDAALDGHRDTLNAMFKPVRGADIPITLRLTRDDGKVRQIDCQRTGPLTIPLEKMNRPGHFHRAVVQLRAADPTMYDPAVEEETFVVPSVWWQAFSTIGTANALEHVEAPTQGQVWANSGSVAAGGAWSIFFRSGTVTPSGTALFALEASVGGSAINFFADTGVAGTYHAFGGGDDNVSGALMGTVPTNVFMIHNGGTLSVYSGTALMGTEVGTSSPIATGGTPGRWRSNFNNSASSRWPAALTYAAIYNIALSDSQRLALNVAAGSAAAGSVLSLAVPYAGDWDSYPVITITGPVGNPVITNTTTGATLDFTGGTVGSADVWVIDTRYGYKSALNGTVSVERYLSDSSDLSTFHLAPDPIATGGTNVITVSGTATGTATLVELSYYNRYVSF